MKKSHDHKSKALANELQQVIKSSGMDILFLSIERGEKSSRARCAINRLARITNELKQRINEAQ